MFENFGLEKKFVLGYNWLMLVNFNKNLIW